MQDFFTFSKLYDYSPKLDNFEKKRLVIMLPVSLNFRQSVSKELSKVIILCVEIPFLYFWYWSVTILFSVSQQRADMAGMDVMLCHCIWRIYQINLWIHRRATVKVFMSKKNREQCQRNTLALVCVVWAVKRENPSMDLTCRRVPEKTYK